MLCTPHAKKMNTIEVDRTAGEADRQDHRRILGADHRRRRQLQHVRLPGARRGAGHGRADRHLGRVPDVPGQGACQGEVAGQPSASRTGVVRSEEAVANYSACARSCGASARANACGISSTTAPSSISAASRINWCRRPNWPSWRIPSTTSSRAAAKAPGSRQERLLHRAQAVPHGAGAEAVRLHALLAVGRRAVGGRSTNSKT